MFYQEKYILLRYQPNENIIQVLVADDGIGVHKSLTTNPDYNSMSEEEACFLYKW